MNDYFSLSDIDKNRKEVFQLEISSSNWRNVITMLEQRNRLDQPLAGN